MELFKKKSSLENDDKKRNKLKKELEKKKKILEQYAKINIKQTEKFNNLREEYNKMASKFEVKDGQLKMIDKDEIVKEQIVKQPRMEPVEQPRMEPVEQLRMDPRMEPVEQPRMDPRMYNKEQVMNRTQRFETNENNYSPTMNNNYNQIREDIIDSQLEKNQMNYMQSNVQNKIVKALFNFVDGSVLTINIYENDIESFIESISENIKNNIPFITNEAIVLFSNVKFINFE